MKTSLTYTNLHLHLALQEVARIDGLIVLVASQLHVPRVPGQRGSNMSFCGVLLFVINAAEFVVSLIKGLFNGLW